MSVQRIASMSTFFKALQCRLWGWMTSKEAQSRIEYGRVLVPIAILGLLALWLAGTVAAELNIVAHSI
jgi:hypothetical protein